MASPIYIEPTATLFTAADWVEAVALAREGGAGVFSWDNAEDVLPLLVAAEKVRSAIPFILGYAWTEPGSYGLHWSLPARHPDFPFLYAKSLSYQPFAPAGQPHYVDPPVGGANTVQQPWRAAVITNNVPYRLANYQFASVLVRFHQPRYHVLADDHPAILEFGEAIRFCTAFDSEPSLDQISGDGTQAKFIEGTSPPNGTTFPGQIAVQLRSTRLIATWTTAYDYVFDEFRAKKIEDCVGTVNRYPLFDLFPGGTMLFEPPKFERFRFPVATKNPNNTSSPDGDPLWGVTATLSWKYFDPVGFYGADPQLRPGWNSYPWAVDGKFYAASRDGTTGGPYIVPRSDHGKIFEHVKRP